MIGQKREFFKEGKKNNWSMFRAMSGFSYEKKSSGYSEIVVAQNEEYKQEILVNVTANV